jgi:hypothetical protein
MENWKSPIPRHPRRLLGSPILILTPPLNKFVFAPIDGSFNPKSIKVVPWSCLLCTLWCNQTWLPGKSTKATKIFNDFPMATTCRWFPIAMFEDTGGYLPFFRGAPKQTGPRKPGAGYCRPPRPEMAISPGFNVDVWKHLVKWPAKYGGFIGISCWFT